MSANRSNRFGDIYWSSHLLSTGAPADQGARAATDTVKAIPHPSTGLPSQSHDGTTPSSVKPLGKMSVPSRGKYHQNAIPRASVADVAPSWQARTMTRTAASGASVSPRNGHNAQDFEGADSSFGNEMTMTRNVIVIIDERALVRDCLMHCLQAAYVDHEVFAFATLSDWVKAEDDYPVPSVILLCVRNHLKKPIEGSDDTDGFSRLAMSAPLVIISDIEDASRIMRAIENGARGYIPTSMTLGIAVEAVRLVEAGGTFVPINCVMPSSQNQDNGGSQLFTARQIMVVEALCRGKANKQIAFELGMCESTVKVHIRHIMRKLKARNRTEVAMMVSNLFDKFDQKSWADT
jgi:DNA-binding NarL/FixJ family response regulator